MGKRGKYVEANRAAARWLDRFLPAELSRRVEPTRLVDGHLSCRLRVADVGGGKKPCLSAADVGRLELDLIGMDIDAAELARAPDGVYGEIRVIDLDIPEAAPTADFDLVICLNTLEHVGDARVALNNLCRMLRPGGTLLVAAPCRHAVFAHLNRQLPERLKRRLLFGLFPGKRGDGFPARYDRASPPEYTAILEEDGLEVVGVERIYWSSYFTLFFPLYALWRAVSLLQRALVPGYCERFIVIARRPAG